MNINYGKLVNGAIIHAPSSLDTPAGLIMNPKRLSYLHAGWKFLDLQPPVDPPPEGREYRITGYTETATDIQAVFKLVPVVSPPRTFSKLRLVTALTERNAPQMSEANRREAAQIAEQSSARAERSDRKGPRLWPAIRDWLEETGYYDLFAAAQDIREDHPQFAAALAAIRTRFSLTPDQIAAVLAESATT